MSLNEGACVGGFPLNDLTDLCFAGAGEGFDDYTVVEGDQVVSSHKWRTRRALVFNHGGKFWRMLYWNHHDEGVEDFEVEEVEPVTETVTRYRRVA